MTNRSRPWPFARDSLFLADPAHDGDDRQVFDHVLKLIREDFKISEDNTDPRLQIMLDDVVNTLTDLAVMRSRRPDNTPPEKLVFERRDERRLRDELRKGLVTIMNFTNPRKMEKKVTIEGLLNKMAPE